VLNRFSGGDYFYGYRITLELLACLTPAFALSAPQMGRIARGCFAPLLTMQALVIATGATIGGLGSRAEEVWTRHSFFTPLASSPVALVAFVLVCLRVGVLARRIWRNPQVSRPHQ
jgi:alpha-1,2-mannosyltransferase